MKKLKLALFALLFGTSAIVQGATIMISQPTFTRLEDYQPTGFGQSFTANGNYFIGAVNLYISSSYGGSDTTLRLFDFNSLASSLGNSVLGSGVLQESSLSSSGSWRTISLDVPVRVFSGSAYAFTIIAKDSGGIANGWNNYGMSPSDVYSGGNQLSIGSGASVTKQTADLSFQVVSVTVPEPSSSLFFVSAVMLAFSRRTIKGIAKTSSMPLVEQARSDV